MLELEEPQQVAIQATLKRQQHKYSQTTESIQPWIDQHECIQIYLQRLNANKKRTAVNLFLFCEWATQLNNYGVVTPESLLALKNSFENSQAEHLLDKFTIAKTVFPDSFKFVIINNVKAFFRCNYRQLQSAAGKFEYNTKKSHKVTPKQDRLALFKACFNLRDQALIMSCTCTSIARETQAFLQWNYFEEDWQRQEIPCISLPSSIIKGHGKGKYRGVQQVSFLTPEAKRVFLEYRLWYQKTYNHIWKLDDYIFLGTKGNKIHKPLTPGGISRRIDVLANRAGVNFASHDGRIIVQTALENVGVSPNWVRKIKGRKVKGEDNPYSKPVVEQLRAKYKEALADLQFLGPEFQENTQLDPRYGKLAQMLKENPDKAEKFEKFLLDINF